MFVICVFTDKFVVIDVIYQTKIM